MTPEQREFYDQNGYLVVRELFRTEELKPWLERLAALIDGSVEPASPMLLMRDVMVAKGAVQPGTKAEAIAKLQDFQNDPVLFGYARSPQLLDWIEALIGPDIKAIHNMLINKPPNVDGRHPLHQDLLYFPFRPANAIVASWTALEEVTRENGCLVIVAGSHLGELLPHGNPDWEYLNLAYFGAKGVAADPERVHLEMAPGDTVFFHPLLLHGSGRNRSTGFRRAISCHFASSRCEYLPDMEPYKERAKVLLRGRSYEGRI